MKLLFTLLFAIQLLFACEPTIYFDSLVTIYDETSFTFEQEADGGFRAWAEGYYLAIGPSDTLTYSCEHDSVTMNWLRAGCYQLLLRQDAIQCTATVLLRWYDYMLPVELLSFRAEPSSDCIILYWEVASESDGIYYQLLRDGLMLADMQGGQRNYEYRDRTAQPGEHEYYLACVENGRREFLDSVTVLYSQDALVAEPSMECFSDLLRFELPRTMLVKIEVFNVLGRKVATIADNWHEAGIYEVNINDYHLTSGIYFVHGQLGKATVTKKMSLVK